VTPADQRILIRAGSGSCEKTEPRVRAVSMDNIVEEPWRTRGGDNRWQANLALVTDRGMAVPRPGTLAAVAPMS
jgi:hypothetical protein